MSVIFGIVNHKSQPIEVELFEKMNLPLKHFPQQKSKNSFHQEAAFGKVLRYQTPEDLFDDQPVHLIDSNLLFTAEGRIDNRKELFKDLEIADQLEVSDSSLMLRAYQKYGKSVQLKLKGDWSLAVYDYETKEIFLARDTLGYTALYFYNSADFFAFSTSIKSILALPYYKKELNEEYFVSFLSLWNVSKVIQGNETLFQNVFFLKGGCTLQVTNGKVKISSYWPSKNFKEIIYRNKQDYSEHMFELIQASVLARLRSHKPVASMLSGGLDSSMVSWIAADLIKKSNQQLRTYSHVPIHQDKLRNHPYAAFRVLDETRYMEAIVRSSGNINPTYLTSSEITPWQGLKQLNDVLDGFIHGAMNGYWLKDIYSRSAEDGYGVLLTGEGGNGSTSFAGLDHILPHSISRFIKNPLIYLRNQIAKPLVLKPLSKSILQKRALTHIQNSYLSVEIKEKYKMISMIKQNKALPSSHFLDLEQKKREFVNLYQMRSLLGATFGNQYGIELRDPTTDVDVMNFFFSIPNDVFFDENYTPRMLVKRMMENKIPKEVLYEKNKGLQSSDIIYKMRATKEELLTEFQRTKDSSQARKFINLKKLSDEMKIILEGENIVTPLRGNIILKTLASLEFLNKNFESPLFE